MNGVLRTLKTCILMEAIGSRMPTRPHRCLIPLLFLSACAQDGTLACDANSDIDGDGLNECSELAAGLDPEDADSDGDGEADGAEMDCGSDPLDPTQVCYLCGWRRGDSSDLVATGSEAGDTISNLVFIDQCAEEVALWDFAEEYHILWMTATW